MVHARPKGTSLTVQEVGEEIRDTGKFFDKKGPSGFQNKNGKLIMLVVEPTGVFGCQHSLVSIQWKLVHYGNNAMTVIT